MKNKDKIKKKWTYGTVFSTIFLIVIVVLFLDFVYNFGNKVINEYQAEMPDRSNATLGEHLFSFFLATIFILMILAPFLALYLGRI